MISVNGPLQHFHAVLNAASTAHKATNSSAQLPGRSQHDRQLPKALDSRDIATTACPPPADDRPAFITIRACIQSAIERADHSVLTDYLKTTETLEAIQALNEDDKVRLAEMLFKDTGCLLSYHAFTTQAGMYLATQPTSDQLMVGKVASLIMEYKKQSRSVGVFDPSFMLNSMFLRMFIRNGASHCPSQLIIAQTSQQLTTASHRYYGVTRTCQPTKNVSQPCPLCHAHQSDQKQHDMLFHPQGLETTGPTPLVYSEKLLTLVDEAHLSDELRARLLPPALFSLFDHQALDFFSLNESALIFPRLFLSSQLCKTIDEFLDEELKYCDKRYVDNIPGSETRGVVHDCFESMMRFTPTIPVLARVGCEIKALLARRNVEIPKVAVSDRYLIKKFAVRLPRRQLAKQAKGRIIPHVLASAVARFNKVHPFLAGSRYDPGTDFFSRKAINGVLKEAMNNVCARSGSDLRPGSGPNLIGYIPSEVADSRVQDGFLDSNWSYNFLHGKYPHALALTCLACLNGLDRRTLKAIIDNKVWGPIIDNNPYRADINFHREDPTRIRLNVRAALEDSANSPFKFQQLLTTGELSASLRDIKRVILMHNEAEQDVLLAQLGERMAMSEPLSLDDLTQITEHIDVLEKVVATKHLNSIRQTDKFTRLQTPGSDALYNPEVYPFYCDKNLTLVGNFRSSPPLAKVKAERCLYKGQKVEGVYRNEQGKCEVLAISSLCDINRCFSFIAYPRLLSDEAATSN